MKMNETEQSIGVLENCKLFESYLERSFAGMNPDVFLEVVLEFERLAALVALEFPQHGIFGEHSIRRRRRCRRAGRRRLQKQRRRRETHLKFNILFTKTRRNSVKRRGIRMLNCSIGKLTNWNHD